MNGAYLSEFATQPGGPEGRPHTTAGSKPIVKTGRPRGVRPCSPLLGWRSSHLVPSPVSTSRPHGGGPAQARKPLPARGLLLNHARYDAFGELAAEYVSTDPTGSAETHYLSTDHLGSTRLVTNQTGAVVSRHDYLPFGWELYSGLTGRTNGHGYLTSPEGVHTPTQRFTGKERDAETGLDYFGARYLSGVLGRWTGADPKGFSARTIANPQKWNKYAYVLNNPLALVDPDGLEEVKVTYRAFIPTATASVAGFTYRGDNRGFSAAPSASSRIAITVTVETDPRIRSNPLIGKPDVSVGSTHRISPFPKTETAKDGLPTANVTRDASGAVVIQINANAKNPLGPIPSFLEPGIKPNLSVTIPTDASTASVTGQTSGFPSQEVNATVGNATTPLLQFTPASSSPTELFKTVPVSQTKPLPQCTTDADGKRVCK